jgi:hypothetical protein
MQASQLQASQLPESTIVIWVANKPYDLKKVKALVPGATKVMFGFVAGKFSAIFHFDTLTPPKVNKLALGIQIETSGQKTSGQKPSVCCGSDCCVAGGGRGGKVSTVVHTPTASASVPVPIDYDITIERPAANNMFNPPLAGKLVRNECDTRGYTLPLKLAILKSPVTQLLTARITTSGTIPLTEDEVRALIYRTECVYKRVGPSAHSV